jgi:prepilin-type N-terminal cleavage/methylation domain-containing protein
VRASPGFTLIEAVVALALVAIAGLSVSTALVASRAVAVRSRAEAIGSIAARARLAALMEAAERTAPVLSPAGALQVDSAGCVDYLDAIGRELGAGDGPDAAYVRRWSIGRHGRAPGEVTLFAVLVAPIAVAARTAASAEPAALADQPGVVVLRGARVRRPS